MKNWIKKLGNNLAWFIIGAIVFGFVGVALANNLGVLNATQKGDLPTGLISGNYQLLHPGPDGTVLTASSTSPNGLAFQTASSTGGNGISSLNGLVASTQLFATGSAIGLNLNIVSSGSTHTFTPQLQGGFNIPLTASTTQWNGLVNSPTWIVGNGVIYNATSTNNVGIGTSNPSNGTLDIVGQGGSVDNYPLWIEAPTTFARTSFSINNTAAASTTNMASFLLRNNTNSQIRTSFQFDSSFSNTTDGSRTSQTTLSGANNGTFGAIITLLGANVGIGTTTPGQTLVISGSTTITSLGAGLVQSTANGGLFIASLPLSVSNGGTGAATLPANTLLLGNGTSAISGSSLSQSGGVTLINGSTPIIDGGGDWLNNVIQTNATNVIVQTNPNAFADVGGFVQNGGVTTYSTSTSVPASVFCNGGGAIDIATSTAGNITLTLPTLAQIQNQFCTNAGSTLGTLLWAGSLAQQVLFNFSNFNVTIAPSGTGESIASTLGSSPTVAPGQQQTIWGSFINNLATVQGVTTTGTSLIMNVSNFQPTSTAPSVQGQIESADATGRGFQITNLVAGSNITITTSTPNQITFAATGGGGLSGGTNGENAYWTGSTSLGASGDVFDNGVVAGVNATSSTINYDIQGTANNNVLNVASSSTHSILEVLASNGVLIPINASSTNSSSTNASTVPVLQFGQTALSSPSANGTYIGLNAPTGFTGNLIQLQTNGTNDFVVGNNGQITTGTYTVGGNLGYQQTNAQVGAVFEGNSTGGTGYDASVGANGARTTTTGGGDNGLEKTIGTISPTSGSAVFALFGDEGTINQTITASGVTRGIYINPTVTKASDFRGLEVAPYTDNLAGSYSSTNAYEVLLNAPMYASSSIANNTATITAASVLTITGPSIASASTTISSSSALTILGGSAQSGTGTTTNAYGIYVNSPTGALNNYAFFGNGNFKLTGTATVITPSISGAIVGLGCDSATSSVDSTVASSTSAFITTPQNYPGDGLTWQTYLSAPGVITTKVCSDVTVTPSASQYVVKIIQ